MDGCGGESDCRRRQVVEELLGLYTEFGCSDYIGENVTQVQHALQAANAAETERYPTEVLLSVTTRTSISALYIGIRCLLCLSMTNTCPFNKMHTSSIGLVYGVV